MYFCVVWVFFFALRVFSPVFFFTELDETTKQLLVQSSEATFASYTQDEIHEEYVKQELKREWNEFKHNVVIDTINARGIRPGYGKWAK